MYSSLEVYLCSVFQTFKENCDEEDCAFAVFSQFLPMTIQTFVHGKIVIDDDVV
jgi:hypothetical protein